MVVVVVLCCGCLCVLWVYVRVFEFIVSLSVCARVHEIVRVARAHTTLDCICEFLCR